MNKNLFNVSASSIVNNAGGNAIALTAKQALAQIACTGCFNDTYYVSAETQLKDILNLCSQVEPEFVAKLAIYARERGFMKDMPAMLLAHLGKVRPDLFAKVLPRIVDNPKMLRNVAQMLRSGVTGRKSFGTSLKRTMQNRLNAWNENELFRGSIGNTPSLADVIKMVHPRPATPERAAMYGYLLGKSEVDFSKLPESVRDFEEFKKNSTRATLPNVPFEMLTAMPLTEDQWVQIATNASWTQTRMNLNTFARHGVFKREGMDQVIANKLSNRDLVKKAKVFPYQLLVAYLSATDIPSIVKDALEKAMEYATENIPALEGKQIYVFPDVSGSMRSAAVTGNRGTATTAVRAIQVAALIASSMLRVNPQTRIIPFETDVVPIERLRITAENSVMTNAKLLASIGGGGTNCSAPLAQLNREKAKGDLIIYASDNESWIDGGRRSYYGGGGTGTLEQWNLFKSRNPEAKMICIDLTPNRTTQASTSKDILNVGGFSDQVFDVMHSFLHDGISGDHWVKRIESIAL